MVALYWVKDVHYAATVGLTFSDRLLRRSSNPARLSPLHLGQTIRLCHCPGSNATRHRRSAHTQFQLRRLRLARARRRAGGCCERGRSFWLRYRHGGQSVFVGGFGVVAGLKSRSRPTRDASRHRANVDGNGGRRGVVYGTFAELGMRTIDSFDGRQSTHDSDASSSTKSSVFKLARIP